MTDPDVDRDPADDRSPKPPERSALPDIFAGAGVGVLLGTVLSLSITPVVAGFISALSGLLAVFLGLDGSSSGKRMLRVNALRIGSFGFATVLAIGAGVYLRASDPLKPAPEVIVAKWQAALPKNPTLALQMALLDRDGVEPKLWAYVEGQKGTEGAVNASLAAQKSSVLQSGEDGDGAEFDCNRLDPESWGNDPAKVLAQYTSHGAPAVVRSIGESLSGLAEEQKADALQMAYLFVCDLGDAGAL